MHIHIHDTEATLGAAAAVEGIGCIRAAIERQGNARVVIATGTSQFAMLDTLVTADIDWARIELFHLDEYVGISPSHPASFRRYLRERVLDRLPRTGGFHAINGDSADLDVEINTLNQAISARPVDLCFAGIGENGHLAFNDPPADFVTEMPYIIVPLDEACRRQQVGEGWFDGIDAVPVRAVSMSIAQIMKSGQLILSVPGARKADAVRGSVEGPVSPLCPASIVQRHPAASLHLDTASAARLAPRTS